MNAAKLKSQPAWLKQLTDFRLSKLSPAWTDSLTVYICGRIAYSLVGLFIWWVRLKLPLQQEVYDKLYYGVTPQNDGIFGALIGVWQRWDAIHFQRIATYGYTTDYLTAFFPLYPGLSGLLSKLTHWNILLVMILVSNLAFFFSLVLVHKIVSAQYSQNTARGVLVAMLLFPTGFYFYAISPQSTLILWIVLAYWMVRQKQWAAALAAGLLAGLTHPTSILLSVLLGVEVLPYLWPKVLKLREKRFAFRWPDLPVIAVPVANLVGTVGYMLWRQMAGFANYQQVQAVAGDQGLFLPWQAVAILSQYITTLPLEIDQIVRWINVGTYFGMVFLTIWNFKRIPWSWWVYQLATLLFLSLYLSTRTPLLGFFRYILIVFPLYVEIILLGQKGWAQKTKFILGLILGFICSALYFMWQGGLS